MRCELKVQDFKAGWFTVHKRCITGKEILQWIVNKTENDYVKACNICQKMSDLKIIDHIEGKKAFDQNEIYRFYFDKDGIGENEMRKWKGKAGNPVEISIGLLARIDEVYQQALAEEEGEDEEEEGGFTINHEFALKSPAYKQYI